MLAQKKGTSVFLHGVALPHSQIRSQLLHIRTNMRPEELGDECSVVKHILQAEGPHSAAKVSAERVSDTWLEGNALHLLTHLRVRMRNYVVLRAAQWLDTGHTHLMSR